jgi:hypothetical protein
MPQAWINRTARDICRQRFDTRFAPYGLERQAVNFRRVFYIGQHDPLLLQIVRVVLSRSVGVVRMGMGRVVMVVHIRMLVVVCVTVSMVVMMIVIVPIGM